MNAVARAALACAVGMSAAWVTVQAFKADWIVLACFSFGLTWANAYLFIKALKESSK